MKSFCSFLLITLLAIGVAKSQSLNRQLDKKLYISYSSYKLSKAHDYKATIEINYLNTLKKLNPKLSEKEAIKSVNEVSKTLDYFTDLNAKKNTFKDYLKELTNLATSGTKLLKSKGKDISNYPAFLQSLYNLGSSAYSDLTGPSDESKQTTVYGMINLDKIFRDIVLDEAYDNCISDEVFNRAYGALFSSKFDGLAVSDEYMKILERDPEFASFISLKEILNSVSGKSKKEQEELIVKGINDLGDRIALEMKTSNALLKKILAKQVQEEELKRIRELEQIKDEATSDAINLLSFLGGLAGGPELANQVSTLGNSMLSIKKSIERYKYVSSKFGDEGGSFLGSITLSANLLTAALNIFQLFSAPNSFEKQVLQKLDMISQQIHVMYVEMHQRFDVVDLKLDRIFDLLEKGFKSLSGKLDDVQKDLNDIKESLYSLNENLNNYTLFTNSNINIEKYSNLEILIGQMNRPEPLTEEQFNSLRDNFHTYATRIINPYNQLDFSNRTILSKLLTNKDDFMRATLLNNIFLNNYGILTIKSDFPDILMWVLASNGIIQLNKKYPHYNIPANYIENIIRRGKSILEFQKSLKYKFVNSSPSSKYQVVDAILDAYKKDGLSFIKLEINNEENDFFRKKFNGRNPFQKIADNELTNKSTITITNNVSYTSRSDNNIKFKSQYVDNSTESFSDSLFFYNITPKYFRFLSTIGLYDIGYKIAYNYFSNQRTDQESQDFKIYDKSSYYSPNPEVKEVLSLKQDFFAETKTIPLELELNLNHPEFQFDTNYPTKLITDTRIQYLSKPLYLGMISTRKEDTKIIPLAREFKDNIYGKTYMVNDFRRIIACKDSCDYSTIAKRDLQSIGLSQWIFRTLNNGKKGLYVNDLSQLGTTSAISNNISSNVDFHFNTLSSYLEFAFPQSTELDDSLTSFLSGQQALLCSDNMKRLLIHTINKIDKFTDFQSFPYIPDSVETYITKGLLNFKWWEYYSSNSPEGSVLWQKNIDLIREKSDSVINSYYITWEKNFLAKIEEFKKFLHNKIDESISNKSYEEFTSISNIIQNLELLNEMRSMSNK